MFTDRASAEPHVANRQGDWRWPVTAVLAFAVALGASTGLVQALVHAARRFALNDFTWMPHGVFWMAPIAFLNFFDAHEPYGAPGPWRRPGAVAPTPMERYDGGIARIDARIGVALDSLRARGTLDRTIIIVTSDHGEQFGEHGLSGGRTGTFPVMQGLVHGDWHLILRDDGTELLFNLRRDPEEAVDLATHSGYELVRDSLRTLLDEVP